MKQYVPAHCICLLFELLPPAASQITSQIYRCHFLFEPNSLFKKTHIPKSRPNHTVFKMTLTISDPKTVSVQNIYILTSNCFFKQTLIISFTTTHAGILLLLLHCVPIFYKMENYVLGGAGVIALSTCITLHY